MRNIIVKQLLSRRQEVAMRRARLVPGKHGISALMLALKEAEKKAEYIPVHMHQENKEKQQLKYKDKIPTLMVHTGQINENIKLCIPTEE